MTYDDKMVLSDGMYLFHTYDYGRTIPFKLYDYTDAAFNASTYTGYIKIFSSSNGGELLTEISPSWTTQASGIGSFAFTTSNYLATKGTYRLECQLEKSGTIRTFQCIHPIAVIDSPTGTRSP